MISGYLSGDAINTVIRGLGQKRRSGILEITAHSERFEVFFLNGKIAGARLAEAPVSGILERLCLAGLLSPAEVGEHSELTLEECYRMLVTGGKVSHESFRRAKLAEESDLLHAIVALSEGSYEFLSQVPVVDRELSLSLTPGQLLIDAIQYRDEQLEFAEIFSCLPGEDLTLAVSDQVAESLSETERQVLECVRAVSQLSRIHAQALLPGREITHALLSLGKSGILKKSTAAESEPNREAPKSAPKSAMPQTPVEQASVAKAPPTKSAVREAVRESERLTRINERLAQSDRAALVVAFIFLVGVTVWSSVALPQLNEAFSRFASGSSERVIE